MKYILKDILQENSRRRDKLFAPYDPFTGEGSPVPRFKLKTRDGFLMLPQEMEALPIIQNILQAGDIQSYCASDPDPIQAEDRLLSEINHIRVAYDFEFWAAKCVKIWDKISKKEVAFILRKPQRKTLIKFERARLAKRPIRVIIDKARQWGGSTLTQVYMAWIQVFRKESWHSAIVAMVDDQARHIRGMYKRMARSHPKQVASITFQPYEGSQKTQLMVERNCIVGVGSVTKPDNLRTYDFTMVHMSEVSSWKSTPAQSAEDLAQTVKAAVAYEPYTLIVEESTPKGVGNFFHQEWLAAIKGESGYEPLFVAWFEIEIYQREIEDYEKFVAGMNDYDWFQWKEGATLEGINWYKTYKRGENYDDWRMMSEFPTTWQEGFQSTGRRAFSPFYVANARASCIRPIFIGDITGDAQKGKEAFKNLKFEPNSQGNLRIWSYPDKKEKVSGRYCLFGDVGGRNRDADYSVVKIFDRYWMMDGGVPEVAAVWHGHIDQDLFAWKAAQLAYIYNNGLLAIEVNSLIGDNDEGDHSMTVLDEIADFYDNLYTRSNPQKVAEGAPVLYGFHTNKATKPMIIDALNGALRDTLYIEKDERACNEMDSYEIKENGSYGAVEGAKDDHVIVTAGGIWLAYDMELPRAVERFVRQQRKPMNEATF